MIWSSYLAQSRGERVWGRRFLSKFSTIVLGLAVAALVMTGLAAAAPVSTIDSSAMLGNEAEDAIAVNPTNTSNVVTMARLRPSVAAGLSTDGGMSFTKVADIAPGGDQPSISVGANSVWVSYATSPGKQIHAFGAPVRGLGQYGGFTAPEDGPNPGGNGDYGDTAVGPSGQVMVTYQKNESGKGGTDIFTAVDADGLGRAGFNAPVLVAHSAVGGFDPIPAQPDRTIDAEANLAWDRSGGAHRGRAYLVWTQETPNSGNNTDIELQHSDDNGATWSPAVKRNDDHTVNSQYLPAIALDQTTGNVALSWYDTRNDLGTGGSGDTDGIPNDDFQVWGTYSMDGGATFAPNFRISPGTSNATQANGSFDVGDYTHAAFVGGTFWPAWSDNSNSTDTNPDGTLHQFDLYTAKISVP